jgi:hypothetical protein
MCGVDSLACDCRISGNVSKYLKAADIVFLGRVTFSDDDGSGTFVQKTLVHFEVEQAFKGVGAGVRDIWVEPGSMTSCYAGYLVGERHLVFAYAGAKLPVNTAAMTTAPIPTKEKPLPLGIDPSNPPVVYYAPECTGTLLVTSRNQKLLTAWIQKLRSYKKREDKLVVRKQSRSLE